MSIATRLIKIAAPLAALATLGACATPGFRTEVSRFNALPAAGAETAQGQSFFITTEDPDLAGGIEFGQYADMLSQEMVAEGYVPAASVDSADLIVRMDYTIVDTQVQVYRNDSFGSFGGGFGYGHHGFMMGHRGFYGRHPRRASFMFGYYDPWFDGPMRRQDVTVYTTELDVRIDRRLDDTRLFEGKAMARSSTNALPKIVPNLVAAMFTDFPGNNGETVKITVMPEPKMAK
jgi:Domain of unknown function (DUF4136)